MEAARCWRLAMLALDGLRRGGTIGVAETTTGGTLIGAKFGGPLGAAIGAIAGFVARMVRLFIKGAVEKAREKVKNLYGVDTYTCWSTPPRYERTM